MAGATATRILDAAEMHFAERGFAATSLGNIADEVGIRTPSLYKHFSSKKELYGAVMERLFDPFVSTLNDLLEIPKDERDAAGNLAATLELYFRNPNLARLVQHAALTGGDEMDFLIERWLAPLFARSTELTLGLPLLTEASPEEALHIVTAFHALMSGYVTLAPLHRRLLGEDFLEAASLERHTELLRRIVTDLWRPE